MRTMKKTIAFVLAFAMTFATAFSAIGAKTTASAAEVLTVKAVYDKGVVTVTVKDAESNPVSGASVEAFTDSEYQTSAGLTIENTNEEGVTTVAIGQTAEDVIYYIKAEADDNSGKTQVNVPAKAPVVESDFGVHVYTDGSFYAEGVKSELQMGVVKIKKGVATVAKWDTYMADEDGEVSGYYTSTPKKDLYLAFRTVDAETSVYTEPIFWEIQKNTTAVKAKVAVDKEKDLAYITVGGTQVKGKDVSDDEVSSTYTITSDKRDWVYVGDYIDESFYNTGATIKVVLNGKKPASATISTFKYLGKDVKIGDNYIQSDAKAATAKLKKRANGPTVSINYVKGSVTLPGNTLFRVIKEAEDWNSKFTSNSSKKTEALTGDSGIVEIRKAPTDKALGSKIGVNEYGKGDLEAANFVITQTTSKDAISIENKISDAAIEYYVGATAPTADTKWKTIAKSKKVVAVKKGKATATDTIYVRLKGDKAKKTIASDYSAVAINTLADWTKKDAETPAEDTKLDLSTAKIYVGETEVTSEYNAAGATALTVKIGKTDVTDKVDITVKAKDAAEALTPGEDGYTLAAGTEYTISIAAKTANVDEFDKEFTPITFTTAE